MEYKNSLLASLRDVVEGDAQSLIGVVKSCIEGCDANEMWALMTAAEIEFLWSAIARATDSAIEGVTNSENGSEMCLFLRDVSELCYQFVTTMTTRATSLMVTVQHLHDILVLLDESVAGSKELKRSIAKLCEWFWVHNESGAEGLITQLVPYLLLTALDEGRHDSDVKRLYSVRDSLLLLDYEDPSIQTIQGLLLRCFIDSTFLKVAEGRRFLSFVFNLHQGLHPLVMGVMKPQLGTGNQAVSEAYGDILYRAWRDTDASGQQDDIRGSIEDALQDLAHSALHAAEKKFFRSLRTVLNSFHANKASKGVDGMLLRIYGPILWRSLRSAHPGVRAQAAQVFFDAFPLQGDERMGAVETDQLLQKQFDLLTGLLKDGDHRVRAVAALGVCRVLREFWEVIPPATTHQILSYVVGTLGVDAACASVRASVVNGMCELLNNPLAHPVLTGLLPTLSNLLCDYSERVRLCFVKLLCQIKTIRGFKFYDIVSVDRLCEQLNADAGRPHIVFAMSELLLNSLYPRREDFHEGKEGIDYAAEQVRRCVKFVRAHEKAAVVFYGNLHEHTSVGSATKLCVLLWRQLLSIPNKQDDTGLVPDSSSHSRKAQKRDALVSRAKRRREKEVSRNGDMDDLDPQFTAEAAYDILIVIESIMNSIKYKLLKPSYVLSREMVNQHILSEPVRAVFLRLLDIQSNSSPGSEEHSAALEATSSLLQIISAVTLASEDARRPPPLTRGDVIELYFEWGHGTFSQNSDNRFCQSILDCVLVRSGGDTLESSVFSIWDEFKPHFTHLEEFVRCSGIVLPEESSEGRRRAASHSQLAGSFDVAPAELLPVMFKIIRLMNTIVSGGSEVVREYRDFVFSHDEEYRRLEDILSVIQRVVSALLNSDTLELLREHYLDCHIPFEALLAACVKFWVTCACLRSAAVEETSGSAMGGLLEWISVTVVDNICKNASDKNLCSFSDLVFAACLTPLSDALLTGISSRAILCETLSWCSRLESVPPTLNHALVSLSRIACVLYTESARIKTVDSSFFSTVNDTWAALMSVILHNMPNSSGWVDGPLDDISRALAYMISQNCTSNQKTGAAVRRASRSRRLIELCIDQAVEVVVVEPSQGDFGEWKLGSVKAEVCFEVLSKKLGRSEAVAIFAVNYLGEILTREMDMLANTEEENSPSRTPLLQKAMVFKRVVDMCPAEATESAADVMSSLLKKALYVTSNPADVERTLAGDIKANFVNLMTTLSQK